MSTRSPPHRCQPDSCEPTPGNAPSSLCEDAEPTPFVRSSRQSAHSAYGCRWQCTVQWGLLLLRFSCYTPYGWWGVVFWVLRYIYRYGFSHFPWGPRLESSLGGQITRRAHPMLTQWVSHRLRRLTQALRPQMCAPSVGHTKGSTYLPRPTTSF